MSIGTAGGSAGVMRSSAVMAAGTAVSRVLGLVRATMLAGAIGVAASGDAFSVANTVPNNLYILLAGGVLNAVLVPQITRAARDPDGGQEYLDRLITVSLAILAAATMLVTALSPVLVRLYAGGFDPDLLRLAITFAYLCLPQVFFYGLYTLLGQVLNARGSFGPYMWAPVVNNVVAIAGLGVFIVVAGSGDRPAEAWSSADILLLAGTATGGVVAQALALIPSLRAVGFRWRPRWGIRGVGLGTASRVAGWTFAAVLLGQLGFIITSKVATAGGAAARRAVQHGQQVACQAGQLGQHVGQHVGPQVVQHCPTGTAPGKASYDYAFLLFMLPHSLVTVSLVTALFTRMARSAVAGRRGEVRADLSLGLRLTGVVTVLATAVFIALGRDITASLFPGNSPAETTAIAQVAAAMVLGLVPFSAQYLFQRVFYVFEDARTPFLIQVPVVLTWSIGNLLSLELLPARLIVVGVGLSMTVGNVLGAVLSARLLQRKLDRLDGRRVLQTHLRLGIAAVLSGLIGWAAARAVHSQGAPSWPLDVTATAIGGLLLLGVYAVALRLMRITELSDMLRPLWRRVGSRPA
jgi:putative peptidoglycan lipid II flippase